MAPPTAAPQAQPQAPTQAPTQTPQPSAGPQPGQAPGAQQHGRRIEDAREGDLDLQSALRAMLAAGASDLHLTSGAKPMIRMDGDLTPLEEFDKQRPESMQRSIYNILSQKQRETFEEHLELDFSYALVGEARFRVNLYQQRDAIGAAFRVIPYEIKPLEALGVPPSVSNFAGLTRGLVLVTGPTGSGKSTTLASLIDLVNRQRAGHIMTVEDPIEFLHRHKRSLVNQREVGEDTHSFGAALKHVLRQDPDVILIGELRDLETIQVALTAAETGHLVFATLHTQDSAQTIDRIIDVFPSGQQGQVRTQLATAIQGVVCQALCRRADGPGRAVATEVMVATPAIRNLIREGKTHQIYSSLQAGSRLGMHTMDQHLADLVRQGRISYEVGLETCHNHEDFNRLCGRGQNADTMGGMH
jgi:twitching motility protein PilT